MHNGPAVRNGHSSRSHEEVWKGEFDQALQFISSYLNCRKFEASFQTATSTCRRMRAGATQGGLSYSVFMSTTCLRLPAKSS